VIPCTRSTQLIQIEALVVGCGILAYSNWSLDAAITGADARLRAVCRRGTRLGFTNGLEARSRRPSSVAATNLTRTRPGDASCSSRPAPVAWRRCPDLGPQECRRRVDRPSPCARRGRHRPRVPHREACLLRTPRYQAGVRRNAHSAPRGARVSVMAGAREVLSQPRFVLAGVPRDRRARPHLHARRGAWDVDDLTVVQAIADEAAVAVRVPAFSRRRRCTHHRIR